MSKVVFDKFLGIQLNHDHVNLTGDTMTGALTITPTVDALSKFQVNDQDSNVILSVDTTNNRVGIGKADPGYQLHLAGTGTQTIVTDTTSNTGASRFIFRNDVLGTLRNVIYGSTYVGNNNFGLAAAGTTEIYSDTALTIGVAGNFPMHFFTNGSNERLTILAGGNVGIGATNPTYRLQVVDTGTTTAVNLANVLYVDALNNYVGINASPVNAHLGITATIPRIHLMDTGGSADENFRLQVSSGVFGIGTILDNEAGYSEKLTILQSGNVGIGTTGPTSALTLGSGKNIRLNSGALRLDDATGYIWQLADSTDATSYDAGNYWNTTTKELDFRNYYGNINLRPGSGGAAASSYVTIKSDGNVGIGVTNPTRKLDVYSAPSLASGSSATGVYSQLLVTPTEDMLSGSEYAMFFYNTPSGSYNHYDVEGVGGFVRHTGTGVVANAYGGRFGIQLGGNTGSITSATGIVIPAPIQVASDKTIGTIYGLSIGAQKASFVTTAYGLYASGASDLNYFAGKVGIGTASPDASLDIEGDGTTSGDNAGIRLTNTNTGGITWRIQSGLPGVSGNRLAIYDVTNNKLAACFTLAGVNSPATNGGFALGGLDTALGPLHVLPTTYSPVIFGNAINSYTSTTFPTANKDYCVRSGIGTGTSAVGDYVSVWGGTGATTGLYRIIAVVDATTIQVDRNIHASGSDIADGKIAIAKDSVVFTATDGTNGQAIFSYSHQNKPLQIGGTTLLATTGLAAEDLIFGGDVQFNGTFRSTTANYRRYYHLATDSFDPGASGATWTNPSANTTGGWRLDANTETLIFDVDVHSDWDAVSDLTVEVFFALNVAGANNDTVDLRLQCFYNTVGDTATKTQTLEVATVTDGTQYKVYKATFTINYDEVSNVVEAGDKMGFILNLETDTSEIDDIIVTHAEFYYNTTHTGVESGDV